MKIKSENGIVTFRMKAGKDMVRSKMSPVEVMKIVASCEKITQKGSEIIVDDKYFFPAEIEKKSRKKKATEVTDDE